MRVFRCQSLRLVKKKLCKITVLCVVDAFYVQVNPVFLSCEVLSFLHAIIPHTYSLLSLVYKIPQLSVKSAIIVHTQTTTHVCSVVFVHVMAMPCQLKKRASDHKMTDGCWKENSSKEFVQKGHQFEH